MKKTFLILSFIFALLYAILYLLLNKNLQPIEILYDNKPYKIKSQNLHIAKKNAHSLSIYDTLHNEKLVILSDDILHSAENPVQLSDVDCIDNIINHLVDSADLKDYNGIKIFLVNNNATSANFLNASKPKTKSYVLDLGLYQTSQKAISRFENLSKYYPKVKDFSYKINKIQIQGNILYNLLLFDATDFKTALQICDKLEKEKQECLVTELPYISFAN
jgi:hypothetical protein